MYQDLAKNLKKQVASCSTEAEVRQRWVRELENELGVQFHLERGRSDASYNQVIIEFKNKGLFGGKDTSPAFKEAIHDRLKKYILASAKNDGLDPSDYIGIATDGLHIAFAFIKNGGVEHGHLMPVTGASVALIAQACIDSCRRAVTSENLIEDFGHGSDVGQSLMQALSDALLESIKAKSPNKIKMLFEEWRTLYGQVADLSSNQVKDILSTIGFAMKLPSKEQIPAALFVIHTYNSILIKLLGAEIVAAHGPQTAYRGFAEAASVLEYGKLRERMSEEIEKAGFFSRTGINGFVEEAIFSWYLDASEESSHEASILDSVRGMLIGLALYRTDSLTVARSQDVLKHFYQDLVPDTLRKSLGEFYTPDWLVEVVLDRANVSSWLRVRLLDPTCGSASFLLAAVKRIKAEARAKKWSELKTLEYIVGNVWGFDLNPLAVQAARVNLLIAISDLLAANPGTAIELPILLADAVYSPARNPEEGEDVVDYTIGSRHANLTVSIPAPLAFNRSRLDDVFSTMGELVEENRAYSYVEKRLVARNQITEKEARDWKTPLSRTYGRVLDLHKQNWNGIWFRIVRNFFWSATAGEFDLVVGNPPWVRWSKLPDLYRERVKPTCELYDIFSSTPHHGGNELDISAMISYTASDKWLKEDGTLAFLITQTVFQSPSSEGFRRFRINSDFGLVPKFVDDLKALKPFPDAANKTAIFVAKKQRKAKPVYPLPYNIWTAKAGARRAIPVSSTVKGALSGIDVEFHEATPVGGLGSPWCILPKGRFGAMSKLTGQSTWAQGRKGITVDLNGIYFVDVCRHNASNGLVEIETRPEAGKTSIGPKQKFWIEPDLLYPLLKGAGDFSACYVRPQHDLFALVPNNGITRECYDDAEALIENRLRKTHAYVKVFEGVLSGRSTYKGRMKGAPFYAIYNVGDYTFSPWKVVWAEQKDFCAAVVSNRKVPFGGKRVVVPDHKLFFVDFPEAKPAYFLCGLLNTEIVRQFIESHVIKTQIGNVFKHLQLPRFDKKIPGHRQLADLVEKAHHEVDNTKRKAILAQISSLGESLI